MSDDVYIKKLDEVYVQLVCEPHIKKELEDCFKFRPPGYKFVPSYKNRMWDGWIRLLNGLTGKIYAGLTSRVQEICEQRGYPVTLDPDLLPEKTDHSPRVASELAEYIDSKYLPRDYQEAAVRHALASERALLLSPTASGKSFIIYLIARYHTDFHNRRVLLIVPTISLVSQMKSDFIDYNKGKDLDIHTITAGVEKRTDHSITISTWQSIYKMPKNYFAQFDVVIGDEAHNFKSSSLGKIMEKLETCRYRYGFTGTIPDDGPVNQLTLEGHFGKVFKVTTTKALIEENTLSKFEIKALVLDHGKVKAFKNYQDEIDFIVESDQRNKFLSKLACSLKGNTLVLFNYVERHGEPLFDLLQSCDKNVFFVHGGIKPEEREAIRRALEVSNDNILLASLGTTSTGVNIVNLDNVIFAHPSKSKIRNLQSIGRVLRKKDDESLATLYDIVDDLRGGRTQENYALKHFQARVQQYANEHFDFKMYPISLG